MYERSLNKWGSQADSTVSWRSSSGRSSDTPARSRIVAVKKIYVTSSPMRIYNELELLHNLQHCTSVCPLITAFRYQDQVVAILPHFEHQDFRVWKTPHTLSKLTRLLSGVLSQHES